LSIAAFWPQPGSADEPMRIAFPSGMNGEVVVTMNKAGLASRNGLNAEFSAFQYGPPMMEALAAGAIDAVVTSMMPVASYAAKVPGDIKIVAMVNTGGHLLLVPGGSTISDTNLAGKKIGVSFGSDSHLDLLVWLREIGLSGKVDLVNVSPAEIPTALGNGSVDGVVARQPQALLLQRNGARPLKSWELKYVSIVRARFARDNPEKVQKYLISLREAMLYMATNADQSAAWFAEYLRVEPGLVREVAQLDPASKIRQLDDANLTPTADDRKMIADRLVQAYEMKLIKSAVDPKTLLDPQ